MTLKPWKLQQWQQSEHYRYVTEEAGKRASILFAAWDL